MSQAFAPKMPRGLSWVWPAIAVIAVAVWNGRSEGQAPAAKKADAPKADAAKAEAEKAQKPVEPAEEAPPTAEIFLDPNAKKALSKMEPLTFVGQPIKFGAGAADVSTIQNMASGATAIDANFLKRYVEFFAVELSKRDNINAMINPAPNLAPDAARGMERAVERLMDPLIRAKATDQQLFLAAYNKALFDSSLVKLLDNNLYSRINAMIVLGMAGSTDPKALKLYTDQLKKADQVVWVKMWAARGITNATRQGRNNLETTRQIDAAEAVITLLDSDPKLPWPVQMRAMEALGSLRLSFTRVGKTVDAASVAMRFLADREARPEVRAWSAWALGMMRAPGQIVPYNFELLGYKIAGLAADLGGLIVDEYDDNSSNFDKHKDRASQLTCLLVFQVVPALNGMEGITETGLLRSTHKSLESAKEYLKKVDAKVKDVTRESYELIRAGGVAQKSKRDDLDGKLTELKGFLAQAAPKDRRLMPNGPEFAANAARVVGAPGR
jgi:hypothetical protein